MDEFDFYLYDDVIELAIAQLDSILEGYGDILEGYDDILPAIEESMDALLSAQDDP